MLNPRFAHHSSLEDEMSKFERELSSLQQVQGRFMQPGAPNLAFTPHVLMQPQVAPTAPLVPPPRPPALGFMSKPPDNNLLSQQFTSSQTLGSSSLSFAGKSTSNSQYEANNLVIESSPSLYKTPKPPNPVSNPGPVPIAPQLKNPQPVKLPPELEESLNAPVNNYNPSGGFAASVVAKNAQAAASSNQSKPGPSKPKKFVRAAGGETWEDPSLSDWDLSDFRVFCGDLGNEVTEDHLRRAFSHYPSLQKVRVVRDKRSNKTKGYGFLSFSDSSDYVRAMKEMNGKYVGNRPIKLRKSSWQERDIHQVRKKEKLKKKLGLR